MAFNPHNIALPVTEIIDDLQESLAQENTVIVNAPPGAGKSTLLPLALMQEPWLKQKKILMLEPRRLAARSIAARMAHFLEEEVGNQVGFIIRFENKTGPKTRIKVLTEGILTRMILKDNALEDVGMVIFDEFHERSIHADVALALCREAQQVLRPDLRILIMSATLDMPQLSSLLQAPVVISQGKQYPVKIMHLSDCDEMMIPEMVSQAILRAFREQSGDILAFLPGEGEISKCAEWLKPKLREAVIHPLYGRLPFGLQQAAIVPNKSGKRKIVLATSIAETSLTIEGIKTVVDSGFGRISVFDPKSGLSRLQTVRISKDSADQRAGRAGRLSPGCCYRLWTSATHDRLASFATPEILEADLANLVLDLAQWGVINVEQLFWLTPPSSGTVSQARELLHQLNALEDGTITEHGKKMHQLPCHPRIAHMLIKAQENNQESLACDLAAFLEERDPLGKEVGIDITLRIEALRRFRRDRGQNKKMGRIEKVAASYRQLLNAQVDNDSFDPYDTGIILAYAYPERIACARPGNNAQFQLANGRYAMVGHKDDLAHEPWLAIAHLDAREGLGKVFLAAPLNPKDLATMVVEKEVIKWDTRQGGLKATKDLRIGNIVLKSQPLPNPDEKHLIKAITEAVKLEGAQLLDFNEKVIQWQNRIMDLQKWRPTERWPDVSTPTLLLMNERWLSPYLESIKKPEDLKKLNLLPFLTQILTYDQQQQLEIFAPPTLQVPSGSVLPLAYQGNGNAPILAVRLQEVFGWSETPKVNENSIPVLLHLLSPGFKPVQITADLKNFWNHTYFEVKKDLKRRYPKHVWPDDPWTEKAVRGTKRKSS